MKKILGSCFLFVILTSGSIHATTISDSLKNELRKVSNALYEQGNGSYVITDAIIDGVIEPEQPYHFTYKDSVITINDSQLPDSLKEIYLAKLQKFATNKGDGTVYSSIRSGGVSLSQVFDTGSTFRKQVALEKSHTKHADTRPLIDSLIKDQLIDAANYVIIYNLKGFYINDKKVDSPTADKYIAMIHSLGFVPKQQDDEMYLDNHAN